MSVSMSDNDVSNNDIREELAKELLQFTDLEKNKDLPTVDKILSLGQKLIKWTSNNEDVELLSKYARLLIISMDSPSKDKNFATAFLAKISITEASSLITSILGMCPKQFSEFTGSKVSEIKRWQTLIHFMILFGSSNGWTFVKHLPQVQTVLNNLCNKMNTIVYTDSNLQNLGNSLFTACNNLRPLLSSEALNALFSITFKPFRDGGGESLFSVFVRHVLTCPALILHLDKTTRDSLVSASFLQRVLKHLRSEPELIDSIPPEKTMNLMGNVIQLGFLDEKIIQEQLIDWTWVLGTTMVQCTDFALKPGEKSSHHHWHPMFGHYKIAINEKTEGSLKNVIVQLKLLWHRKIVSSLFGLALSDIKIQSKSHNDMSNDLGAAFSKLWKRIGGSQNASTDDPVHSPPTLTAVVCTLYVLALSSMQHLRSDIVSGLSYDESVLYRLWLYLVKWGTVSGSDSVLPHLAPAINLLREPENPHAAPLQLFSEIAASIIAILDEEELYEKGSPFPVSDLLNVAKFANQFCFKALYNENIENHDGSLFTSVHKLVCVLVARDCRRKFSSDPKFWLNPEVKSSVIIREYDRHENRAKLVMENLSHCIDMKERVLKFRKTLNNDKNNYKGSASLITVCRNRILDDGFSQLSMLSPTELKHTIRVKFVNQQGLEEAGIDQDGVFKEFIELTLKKVLDPGLSLFKISTTGVAYPSPTSFVHEHHLKLFEFIGRLLGKAIYEGIVVDFQLAAVLLAAVLGNRRLCAFDELSQLDPELYKNLTFIKKYDGDISDLTLTFSIDDDYLGKIVTTDLIPGGSHVHVTTENKLDYIHRMAHHRVFAQSKDQCKAFVTGIQSILNSKWLAMFGPHELQYLISGHNSDIDLKDLKANTQYFGGFHKNHRLIKWLWEILESDFTPEERRLFLKFVTSSSCPPILGFEQMKPPFSIRCVEVSDDQDQGDTLGSVVRGFLAFRKSRAATRLPTASTCFNLLKLPNYNKKSVLLTKLRYAIHAESGFELS